MGEARSAVRVLGICTVGESQGKPVWTEVVNLCQLRLVGLLLREQGSCYACRYSLD